MKVQKTIILSFCLFISTMAFCQFEKGFVLFGGDINTGFQFQEHSKYFYTAPSASGGYFISSNILLKSNLNAHWSVSNYDDGFTVQKNQRIGFGGGVGARYYFDAEWFQPFVGINGDLNVSEDWNAGVYDNRFVIFIPQIELGINYFINDNVALEFVIPVSYTLYTESSFSSIPPFNFRRLDILPSVGFQVFINKSQITNDEN